MASQNVTRAFDVEAYSLWLLAGDQKVTLYWLVFKKKACDVMAKRFLGDTQQLQKRSQARIICFHVMDIRNQFLQQKMDSHSECQTSYACNVWINDFCHQLFKLKSQISQKHQVSGHLGVFTKHHAFDNF